MRKGCLAVAALVSAAATVDAATLTVDCSAPLGLRRIGDALNRLPRNGPNTLRILGSCRENPSIHGFDRLTLVALQGASIEDASGGQQPVLDIRDSRRIAIRAFRIVGGNLGVTCLDGSLCRFTGNTIEGSLAGGVYARSSQATFSGDTIQDVGGPYGAALSFDASTVDATNLTVQRSAAGIFVSHQSVLTGSGLAVRNNAQDGIGVDTQSHLSLSDSEVSGNGGVGVNFANQSQGLLSGSNSITGNGIFGVGLGDLSQAYFAGGAITGNQFNDVGCWGRYSTATNLSGAVFGTTDCQ